MTDMTVVSKNGPIWVQIMVQSEPLSHAQVSPSRKGDYLRLRHPLGVGLEREPSPWGRRGYPKNNWIGGFRTTVCIYIYIYVSVYIYII